MTEKQYTDLYQEHPEFFDPTTDQIMIYPFTPSFEKPNFKTKQEQKDFQQILRNQTIDFSNIEQLRDTTRFPISRRQVTAQNLYRPNRRLANQIEKYIETNRDRIEPGIIQYYDEGKRKQGDFIEYIQTNINRIGAKPGDKKEDIAGGRQIMNKKKKKKTKEI